MKHVKLGVLFGVAWLVNLPACFVTGEFSLVEPCFTEELTDTVECLLPKQITAGKEHNCIVRHNGTVWCWGSNERSQLGLDRTLEISANHVPALVAGIERAVGVSAGDNHSCAISDQKVWCWGGNDYGQSGAQTTESAGQTVLLPREVDGLPKRDWKMIAAGGTHTCALALTEGEDKTQVWCWGDNRKGQVDASLAVEQSSSAQEKSLGSGIIQKISAGAEHTCAQTDDNIICWGNPRFGKTGRAYRADTMQFENEDPKQVEASWPVANNILDVATGQSHNCTLIDSGEIYCWGSADVDRLSSPLSMTSTNSKPIKIAEAVPMKIIEAGLLHTCTLSALDSGGEVFCWGGNTDFQLGDGSEVSRTQPQKISGSQDHTDVAQLAVGSKHACALKRKSGAILCWGLNEYGQAGQEWEEGSMKSQRHVKNPTSFVLPDPRMNPSVDGGVRDAGSMSVDAGIQDSGMGNGANDAGIADQKQDTGSTTSPGDTDAAMGSDAAMGADAATNRLSATLLATGPVHNCAVLVDNSLGSQQRLRCWGDLFNAYADGRRMKTVLSEDIDLSQALSNGESIVDLQAGDGFTCFVARPPMSSGNRDDKVYCWGDDTEDQYPSGFVDENVFTTTVAGDAASAQIAEDVVVAQDGFSYVVGSVQGFADFAGSCGSFTVEPPGRDVFVAKYAPTGGCRWVERLTLSDSTMTGSQVVTGTTSHGMSIALLEHHVVISGTFGGVTGNAPFFITNRQADGVFSGGSTGFLAGFRRDDGDLDAAVVLENSTFAEGRIVDLALTSQNKLFAIGQFKDEINFPNSMDRLSVGNNLPRVFAAKYLVASTTTNLTFTYNSAQALAVYDEVKSWGFEDVFNAVTVDSQNNVWFGFAYKDECGACDPRPNGMTEPQGLALLKYGSATSFNSVNPVGASATIILSNTGANSESQVSAMTTAYNDQLFITGYSIGALRSGGAVLSSTDKRAFVASYQANGNYRWAKQQAPPANMTLSSVGRDIFIDDTDGRYVLVGDYSGEFKAGEGFWASVGSGADGFLVLGSPTDGHMAIGHTLSGASRNSLHGVAMVPDSNNGKPTADIHAVGYANFDDSSNSSTTFLITDQTSSTNALISGRVQLAHRNGAPSQVDLQAIFSDAMSAGPKTIDTMTIGGGHVCVDLKDDPASNPGRNYSEFRPDFQALEDCSEDTSTSYGRQTWCWGKNNSNQATTTAMCRGFGWLPMPINPSETPMVGSRTFNNDIVKIAAGFEHTCAVSRGMTNAGNRVTCWGKQDNNQCGLSDGTGPLSAGDVESGGNPISRADTRGLIISEGADNFILGSGPASQHSCAVLAGSPTSIVSCWGFPLFGQLHTEWPDPAAQELSTNDYLVTNTTTISDEVLQVSTGLLTTCVLIRNGTVKCWGGNQYQQAGLNAATGLQAIDHYRPYSAAVEIDGGSDTLTDIKHLSMGAFHGCALNNSGDIYCWGRNQELQLGQAASVEKAKAKRVDFSP